MIWNILSIVLGAVLAIILMAIYRVIYPRPMRGIERTILGNKLSFIGSKEINQVPIKTPIYLYIPEDAVFHTAFGKGDNLVVGYIYPKNRKGTEERRTIIVRKEERLLSISGLNYLGHFVSNENENLYVFEVVKELTRREVKRFSN